MGKVFIEESTLTAIGDAIREKNGKSDLIPTPNMPYEIKRIQSGGSSPVSMKDVNFYDYDGTIVTSYTLEEAQSLTELPDAPTHEGLAFQGWNWSLEDIKARTRPMNIGAIYTTDDGKTRLRIHIWGTERLNVPLYFWQSVSTGVVIDWGDGSETETITGTAYVNTTHQYINGGDYTISLAPVDGCEMKLQSNDGSKSIIGKNPLNNGSSSYLLTSVNIGSQVTEIGNNAFYQCGSLENITIPNSVISIRNNAFRQCDKIENVNIPNGVTNIPNYEFLECYFLKNVTIPNGLTSIGNNAFQTCKSLKSITIPDSVTSIGWNVFDGCFSLEDVIISDKVIEFMTYSFAGCSSIKSIVISEATNSIRKNAFAGCQSIKNFIIPDSITVISESILYCCFNLESVNIPNGVTIIEGSAFRQCYLLTNITIPENVTEIGANAFNRCFGMREYHLKPINPPTLSNVNAFDGIPSDCIIYVPQGCLEAYQTATNWATYADYMQEEMA